MTFSKISKPVIVGFSLVVGLSSCNKAKYVEYRPHHLSDNNEYKYYGKSELDSMEFENTIQVLEYYGEDFETKSGNIILITSDLSNNWERLWNYTTKANDNEWLKTHKNK